MTLKKYFKAYRITLAKLMDTALKMYIYDPEFGERNKIRQSLSKEFKQTLKDINVKALLLAGFLLEEELEKGKFRGLTKKKYAQDPVGLIADELLGMQLAVYISGSRSIFEFLRFDRNKPGILKGLPPIVDDLIAGLISGVLVKTCSK